MSQNCYIISFGELTKWDKYSSNFSIILWSGMLQVAGITVISLPGSIILNFQIIPSHMVFQKKGYKITAILYRWGIHNYLVKQFISWQIVWFSVLKCFLLCGDHKMCKPSYWFIIIKAGICLPQIGFHFVFILRQNSFLLESILQSSQPPMI